MTLKICLVALHAYPAIDPSAPGVFGGTETRAWTIAQGLGKVPGLEVSFVVRNPKLKSTMYVNGVKIIPKHDYMHITRYQVAECVELISRFPYIQLRRWKWQLPWWIFLLIITKPFRQMKVDPLAADEFYRHLEADVLCAFGVHSTAAMIISTAKFSKKNSVLFLGSDSDLDERYGPDSTYITPYREHASVCYHAIINADIIVAQKEEQLKLLKDRFGRDGYLFRNPIDISEWRTLGETNKNKWLEFLQNSTASDCPTSYALWIGRAETFHKRADLLVRVAADCPNVPFLMIMNQRDSVVEREIYRKKPANLYILESAPYNLMPSVFGNAKLFVNTSSAEYEGFPNTFLQAAAMGVPILSLETADYFLKDTGAGYSFQGVLEDLILDVKNFWTGVKTLQNRELIVNILSDSNELEGACLRFVQHLRGKL
jgi:glycosyltransferase involved in cell wall biosynthesis